MEGEEMSKTAVVTVEHNTEILRPTGEPGRHDEGPPGGRYQRIKSDGSTEFVDHAGRPFGSEPVGDEEKDEKLAQQAVEIEALKSQLTSATQAGPTGLPPVVIPPPPNEPPS